MDTQKLVDQVTRSVREAIDEAQKQADQVLKDAQAQAERRVRGVMTGRRWQDECAASLFPNRPRNLQTNRNANRPQSLAGAAG